MAKPELTRSTGRRKTSIAQIRLVPQGAGKITINGKPLEDYFRGYGRQVHEVSAPLRTEGAGGYDAFVKVEGGGITGQAQAVRHGIARALAKLDTGFKKTMRKEGWLTRDPRMVERKKPGQPKARKRFQYSKR
ncbi:MAG: 30S ribosomal protein S9 [Elusimicrobia bacterium]|nr:30S ribosomal protein S9 [Elusimicrobiota bacterium]